MSWEIICDNCGREIPEGCRYVERSDGKTFCNDDCDEASNNARYVDYDEWLNGLEVGDEVVVEQPAYRFRYYLTTVIDVSQDRVWAKGFPSVLFTNGECRVGGFGYLLLEPTNELLDKVNLINNRRRLKSVNWDAIDDDVVMDVWDLVYGD